VARFDPPQTAMRGGELSGNVAELRSALARDVEQLAVGAAIQVTNADATTTFDGVRIDAVAAPLLAGARRRCRAGSSIATYQRQYAAATSRCAGSAVRRSSAVSPPLIMSTTWRLPPRLFRTVVR
jgi:hypothetical protein